MNETEKTKDQKILIVEDDDSLAGLLTEEIADAGYRTRSVATAEEASSVLQQWQTDLVVSDLRLPGAGGLELLEKVSAMHVPPAFIVITAFGTISQAVQALKNGADDFLTKPLDLEHFMHRVVRSLETRRLRQEVERFRQIFDFDNFHGMYGQSRCMRILFDQILQTAPASGPVLIVGESGTGKELVAKAVHAESDRNQGPFIAVNCAGIPEHLMESEFFGHTAGAFTGASKSREGLFQEANGGTLLLDEIAEMPMALQAKLLRILQDGKIRPLGGNRERQVDVRMVAATHQNLEKEVEEAKFRQDLFYRLETFTLRIPPLRERAQDIELLAGRLLTRFATQMGRQIHGFSDDALLLLRQYYFPGNVRELQNTVERAVTFCHGSQIRSEDLPARIRNCSKPKNPDFDFAEFQEKPGRSLPSLAEVEKHYINHVLEKVGGNKKKAADILGVARRTLYRRLE